MTISQGIVLDNISLAWTTVNPSSGDLFILFFYNDGGDNQTAPADLTRIGTGNQGTSIEAGCYKRTCTGSETGNVFTDENDFGVSGEGYNAHWFLIPAAEWHGTTQPEVTDVQAATGTIDPPSLIPSGWDASTEDTVWIICGGRDDDDGISAVSLGYATNEQLTFTKNQVEMGSSYRIAATATENPGIYTQTGTAEELIVFTIAVRPAGLIPPTINMVVITLVSAAQGLVPTGGAVSVLATETTLVSSPEAMESVTSVPPAQSPYMSVSTLASLPQALDVLAGAATVDTGAATLASSPQTLDVEPGPVAVPLGETTLVSSPQAMESVSSPPPSTSPDMLAVTLASSSQALDIIPGFTSVLLSTATLDSSEQALSIDAGAVAHTVDMGVAALVSSAQGLNVTVDQTIELGTVTLVGSGQSAEVLPGTVTIQLLAISLNTDGQTLSVTSVIAPVTVDMAYASLVSSALSFNLAVDQALNMGQVILVAAPQDLVAFAGPGSQTVYLDSVSAGMSLLSSGVLPGEAHSVLSAISLVSEAQNLTLILGAAPDRILPMIAQSLASSMLAARLIGGTLRLEVILRASAINRVINERGGVSTTVVKTSSIALEEYEF